MVIVDRVCRQCGSSFRIAQRRVDAGSGIFCSRSCAGAHRGDATGAVTRRCAHCEKPFHVARWRMDAQKGLFCSLACYKAHPRPRTDASIRFWRHVDKSSLSGCWLWTAARDNNGYGRIGGGGLSHRFSYTLAHGEIPEGLSVLHKCNNPPCVNPEHLYAGTQKENMADWAAVGGGNKGETNGMAKLSNDDVKRIRSDKRRGAVIAAEYGVSRGLVYAIRQGRSRIN